jgi:hypothetical protein
MRLLLAPLLALCLITNASAQVSQDDLFYTVARISTSSGVGSGFVFAEDDTTSYIMTCYHVVKEEQASVQFQREGFMGPVVQVETVYKSYNPGKRDLAILALDKSKLNGYSPMVLPLADENVIYDGHKIYTIGHPGGSSNPTMLTGVVFSQDQGLHFKPAPMSGRSGSPIVGYNDSGHFAIGVIGWKDVENQAGRAMNIVQLYKILRGEEVSVGTPLNDYTGTAVQFIQDCPDGQCYPFQRFLPKQSSVNPNNPWIKTPNNVLPNAPAPISDDIEKRLAALESATKANKATVEQVLTTANSVKEQLEKLGVTFDKKLEGYATRDQFGNYVTQTQLTAESKNIVNQVSTGVETIVVDKFNVVQASVDGVKNNVEAKLATNTESQSRLEEKVEKVAAIAGKIAPILNIVPGWGTAASLALGGLATGLTWFGTRKKKKSVDVNPVQNSNQLDTQTIMNLVRREMATTAPQPIQQNVQQAVQKESPYMAPIQSFSSQPPVTPTEINYTVAPKDNDELHFRRAMEAVSRKYPESGHTIKLIEAAYPIFKSGVK